MSRESLIAVIDDDDSAREAIAGLVKAFGFVVAAFQGGGEFLRSQELRRTACLVADMQMPGMSGLELLHLLVQAGTPIPTILVTAYPNDQVRRRALQAGAGGYLVKPIDGEALLACLRTALGRAEGSAG